MAFCGTVEATESAPTQQQALNKANKQGLRETRKLDQQYGASVQYEQAQVQCGEFDLGVTCTITQRFCVNEASAAPDENGVNSPVCQRIFSACNRGDAKSCAVYEEQCQND
jgi:hypothetical protein